MFVEVVAAITWQESGRYTARCLGVADLVREGASMHAALDELADALPTRLDAGWGAVPPDRSGLWQPLPVEMIAPLDVEVVAP